MKLGETIAGVDGLARRDVKGGTCIRVIIRVARRNNGVNPVISTHLENEYEFLVTVHIAGQELSLEQARGKRTQAQGAESQRASF